MNYFETLLRQHAALADRLLAGLPQQAADEPHTLTAQQRFAQTSAAASAARSAPDGAEETPARSLQETLSMPELRRNTAAQPSDTLPAAGSVQHSTAAQSRFRQTQTKISAAADVLRGDAALQATALRMEVLHEDAARLSCIFERDARRYG